jgi:serine/threonine-protein kinase
MEDTVGWELGPITLEVTAGPHQGAHFEFRQHESFLVGRAPDVHLQLLEDAHFSRHHFLLEVNPPRCYLRDLGSSNGTYVNGQKASACYLKDGDVISGGRTRLRIGIPAFDAPSLPPSGLARAVPGTVPPGGLRVPGYDLERLLGQGGMGVVFLARRQATGQPCALKVILPECAVDEGAMKRFLREVGVLSRLVHPRIVAFHEMGIHLGQLFFAMDYVETIDLPAVLAELIPAGRVALACSLTCEVLEGLEYAHGQGFVHRDIKPANVLVSQDSTGIGARLADFGLAKNYENAGFSGMTHEGALIGTLPFMAPEQVIDARRARPAVDLYAVGATLYQLLAGTHAHAFERRKDPLAVILQDDPVPLRRRCGWVPEGLEALVARALARDPNDRFPTAAAMRQALLPFAGPID